MPIRVTAPNLVEIGQNVFRDIAILMLFQVGCSRHFGISKIQFLYWLICLGDQLCVYLPYFIKIGQSVAEIWRFVDFSRWRQSVMLNFEKCDF